MKLYPLIIFCLTALLIVPVSAQDDTTGQIEVTGVVQAIDGTSITVTGLVVDVTSIDVTIISQIQINQTITIIGMLNNDGVVIASQIILPTNQNGNYIIVFDGRVFDGANTTFTYTVTGTGTPPALSHFDIEIPYCTPDLRIISANPAEAVEFGVDPTTGIDGIKWDLPLGESGTRSYSITIAGNIPAGEVLAAVKNGDGFYTVVVIGPACTQAQLDIEKYVSADGGASWADADTTPGLQIEIGTRVSYRFVVTNTGTVPVTNITLTDDTISTETCTLPDVLEPAATFECVLGPFDTVEGAHTNTATVTGQYEGTVIADVDSATYFSGDLMDDDGDIIIIIHGPVTAIVGNIIIIHGIEIELDINDPILTVIQIGDILEIEGTQVNGVIVVVVVVFINVDVVIVDGDIWRDSGDCPNPPPPWAPANGWRNRCQNNTSNNGSNTGNIPSENGRVTICHVSQGNGARQTITVGINAWYYEHSRHGDTLGPC